MTEFIKYKEQTLKAVKYFSAWAYIVESVLLKDPTILSSATELYPFTNKELQKNLEIVKESANSPCNRAKLFQVYRVLTKVVDYPVDDISLRREFVRERVKNGQQKTATIN